MRKLLRFAEHAFTILSLLHYSGAVLVLVLSGGAQENEFVDFNSSLIQILNLLIYLVTFFLLVLRWKKALYVLSKDRFIWVLLLLAVVSIVWSFEPSITLKNSITLIGSSLFGLYLATRYSLKQQLHLLGWTFGIVVVLSFVFAVALPKYGIMGGVHAGKWRGVFLHKNGLGARMVTSSTIFLLLTFDTNRNRWIVGGCLGLSILLLILSVSTSSLLNLVMVIAACLIFWMLWLRYHIMIPALIAIATIGGSFYFWLKVNAEVLFSSLGKDTSLTGRGDLWPLVLEMIWKQPWLGYGYGGFWNGLEGESGYIWYAAGWSPTHPHQGFLALWLDLGLLGLSIFLLGLGRSFLTTLVWVRLSKKIEGLWPITHLTYLVLFNFTETGLLESNGFNWILYVAVSLSVLIPPEKPQEWVQEYGLSSHLLNGANEQTRDKVSPNN